MDTAKRPGGLTALAVFNFIGSFFVFVSAAGLAVLIPLLRHIPDPANSNLPPAQQQRQAAQLEQLHAIQDMGQSLFLTLAGFRLVTAILLLLSGIGYLKQKKILGRRLGNAYGILGIASTIGWVMLAPPQLGSFNIGTMITLIYPVLTLIVINTAFKEDFVN
jgi:hypothetical protein